MKPAAILGSLVDMKNVAVHKSVRLIIDIPAEQAEMVIKMFGWPTQVNPVPVAVARMNPEIVAEAATPLPTSAATAERPPTRGFSAEPKPRKGTLAWQAIRLCRDPVFHAFLRETNRSSARTEQDAAEYVRRYCGVTSRGKIDDIFDSANLWSVLKDNFDDWRLRDKVT